MNITHLIRHQPVKNLIDPDLQLRVTMALARLSTRVREAVKEVI